MSIKPIETAYAGHRFRSRLEARWAVFFDALELKWEYEREGYDLDGVWYLPDFWMPELQCWIEIKGQWPTVAEARVCHALARESEYYVFLFCGDLRSNSPQWRRENGCRDGSRSALYWKGEIPFEALLPEGDEYLDAEWMQCNCGQYIGLSRDRKAFIGHPQGGNRLCCPICNGMRPDTDEIVRAYEAAMSARFEHGEGGPR